VKESLAKRHNVAPHQMLGPIHVHPNGRFVYSANRASGTTEFEGKSFFVGGENSMAVYAINPRSGEPTLIQNIATRGLHARTFSIDPSGRMLVAAHVQGAWVRDTSTTSAYIPACISTFRIGRDGKLTFVAKYDVQTEDGSRTWLYWAGFVARGGRTASSTDVTTSRRSA
jgi:6-phosphogluconolactonase (cycloisomerase 2 family)